MATSDQQLLAKYQSSGEPSDLEELVARHLPVVRNLAYRMVLCNATADDISQDVFVQVMRHADQFRGESKFSTWIYQITMNTVKVHFRKRVKAPRLSGGEKLQHLAHRESSPDQHAIGSELNHEIEQALRQLSGKLRAAIVLTALEHLSAKEAAEVEGCSTATMHWRIHQARKQLKQLLHSYLKI